MRKSLVVRPLGERQGVAMEYSENDDAPLFSVPISDADFFVVRNLMFHALPSICGWLQACDGGSWNPHVNIDYTQGTEGGDGDAM